MKVNELLLYTGFEKDEVFYDMAWLMQNRLATGLYSDEEKKEVLYRSIHKLIECAGNHGFYGNIWHCYLANLLVNSENTYSKACEIRGRVEGTVNIAARHDIRIFKEFFDYDFSVFYLWIHDCLILVFVYVFMLFSCDVLFFIFFF